ncbi:MAG: hypothetical protein ACK4NR_01865 [Micavibrio sp.]
MMQRKKEKTIHSLLKIFLMLGVIVLVADHPAQAQGLSADFSDGSVIIGEDVTACDASMESAIRYNSVAKLHQYCDGVSWTGFVAFAPSVTLTIIPNSISNMNVTGPGSPVYGSLQTFTVQNFGATPSDSLTVSFTDVNDNFDITADGCTGVVLNQNDSCDIIIRPKASSNGNLQATLVIPHNNAPSSLLSGTASGFGCAPGASGGGGVYVSCGAYNLVTTPGGCTDSIYPTCPGTADTLTKIFGSSGSLRSNVDDASNGPQNSVNLMAYVAEEGPEAHPAIEYCMNMIYGGYDDWYLPAPNELLSMNAQGGLIGGWQTTYVSSRQANSTQVHRLASGSIGTTSNNKDTFYNTRCVRRETQALPSIQHDTTPDAFFFAPIMTTTGNRVSSASALVRSITQDVSVSLSNDTSGGARVKINGGAEVTNGTVGYGDIIQLVMTAPGSAGNANTVDVTVGGYTTRWRVGVPNAVGTRRVFVSESSQGSFGGIASADNMCQSEASGAGLGGTWLAIISDRTSSSDYAANRLDFNWATLTNMNGDVVANSWNDLWDGSIVNPINYDENGVVVTTDTWAYTESDYNGLPSSTVSTTCNNWTSSSYVFSAYQGSINLTGPAWSSNLLRGCDGRARFYCFENTAGAADESPVPFEFNPMTKQAAASTTDVESATVTITGVDLPVAISISGAGNPEYRINGGAWTSVAGTIDNGDTLTIRADAPAVNGNRNKVTLNVGTYTTNWYVGAGDSGITRKVFVRSTLNSPANSMGAQDSSCASAANAVGLGTNWASIMSDSNVDDYAVNRTNVNWGTLENLKGEVVATSWADLWDGTLTNMVKYDQTYTARSYDTWTGSTETGRATIYNCNGWSSASTSYSGTIGNSGASSSTWLNKGNTNCSYAGNLSVYCIETGDNPADTTPLPFSYTPMTKQAAPSATDIEAAMVTIEAISDNTAVSISGAGNPEYRINGGAWTSVAGTIDDGDTLTIRADAPATVNQRNKITITVGTYSTYWYVGAGNSANTKRIFVTSGSYTGSLGGVGGADSTCSSLANAAGLGTGWVSLLGDSGVDGYAVNRAPLNWGTLNNMNGDTVASSWEDLWDGSILALINRTQTNAVNNNFVWSASTSQGLLAGTQTCLDWSTSSNSNSFASRLGNSGTSGSWLDANQNSTCNLIRSLYCIEQ